MVRYGVIFRYSFFLLLLVTVGCAQVSQWASAFSSSGTAGQFYFDWKIKGDKRVTPLQVFDDGRRTWLQFAPDTPVPAVFARQAEEDTLLNYHQSGAYVILPGVWSHLVVQGGHLQGHLYRQSEEVRNTVELVQEDSDHSAASPVSNAPAVIPVELDVKPTDPPASIEPVAERLVEPMPGESVMLVTQSSVEPISVFKVGPSDGTMRETLMRWAQQAQWDFGPEHWAVDIDIPIVGTARFDTSFEKAVHALVASSELGDRPLQPCFYSNRVLRIVPFAQPCDRARTMASAS